GPDRAGNGGGGQSSQHSYSGCQSRYALRTEWAIQSGGAGAAPPTARGVLIAYATAPGGVAGDGLPGEDGVYTKHLLQALLIPGLSIQQVLKQVRYGVVVETKGKQTPWEVSSLQEEVVFMPAPADPKP